MTGIRFCEDGKEDELAVCCPDTRRLMDCTVDMVRIALVVCVARSGVGGWWVEERRLVGFLFFFAYTIYN